MPRAAAPKSPYSVHPSLAMVQSVIAGLKAKTGKSLEEWMSFIKKNGPATEKGRRDWLKKEHGLGTNYASWIAERSVGKGGEDDSPEGYLAAAERYVDSMYSGKKAPLRPLYGELLELGLSIGKDSKACPCQTIVPFFRNHVYAQIRPSTNSRIDLGLALAGYKGRFPSRLIDTGGLAKKDRITHRIEITSADQIDAEVKKWLKVAYDLDA